MMGNLIHCLASNISFSVSLRRRAETEAVYSPVFMFVPEPPALLGVLVLGPFMYARGPQLQHWMDMVNTPQEPVKLWHRLSRAT